MFYDHIGQNNDFTAIASLNNGDYLVGGNTFASGVTPLQQKMYFARVDACGQSIWTAVYGQTNEAFTVADIHHPSGTDYFVAAVQYRHYNSDLYYFGLVKLNLLGDTLWMRKYMAGSNQAMPNSVIQTTDGGFALAGYTKNTVGNNNNIWFIKTDSQGNIQWDKNYNTNNSIETAKQVIQLPDEGYLLMGTRFSGVATNILLLRTNAQGLPIWAHTYGNNFITEGNHIIPTTYGYLIAGKQYDEELGLASYGPYLLKVDTLGNMLWESSYPKSQFYPHSIERVMQLPNDVVMCLANVYPSEGPANGCLIKVDNQGNMTWGMYYQNAATSLMGNDCFFDFQPAPNGGYMICGFSFTGTPLHIYDAWIVRTDSLGNACPPYNGCWVVGVQDNSPPLDGSGGGGMVVYPNPATNTLLINATHLTAAHVLTISLYTPQGQLATRHTAPGGATIQLHTHTLPLGIYYCHIQVNGQTPQTQKLVIIR